MRGLRNALSRTRKSRSLFHGPLGGPIVSVQHLRHDVKDCFLNRLHTTARADWRASTQVRRLCLPLVALAGHPITAIRVVCLSSAPFCPAMLVGICSGAGTVRLTERRT